MKKALALILCVLMVFTVVPFAVSCGDEEDDTPTGAVIPAYLTTPIYNFDPAYAYNDEATMQVLSLLFRSLTYVKPNGKIVGELAEEWEIFDDAETGEHAIEFTLKSTAWSNGTTLTASDFVYAWLRLLDPQFTSDAASLLFDIHNAKAYSNGEIDSKWQVGVYAISSKILRVEFDHTIDYDRFLANCASLALSPIYEDNVLHTEWASNPTLLNTVGPFTVRSYKVGESLVLERNRFYMRNDARDSLDKYVRPKTIEINMGKTAEEQLALFDEGSIFYVGYIALAQREKYKEDAVIQDTLTTHTYYFNTNKAPFDSVEFRNALSFAIDRNAIAQKLVFAKAAEGFVPAGAFDSVRKTDFRENATQGLLKDADAATAKQMIQSLLDAGTIQKEDLTFTIKIRSGEIDRAVAEMIAETWNGLGLGFNVTVQTVSYTRLPSGSEIKNEAGETIGIENKTDYDFYKDNFRNDLYAGNFDVIAVDSTLMAPDAFSALAAYATDFSGTAVSDITLGAVYDGAHLSGYRSEKYDKLIATAFAEQDAKARALILHTAEEQLIADMPAMPVFVYQDAVLISSEISKVTFDFYGYYVLTDMKLKNYEKYLETQAN